MQDSDIKRQAIQRMQNSGNIPYKSRFEVTHLAADAKALPDGASLAVAGRVVLWRPFGSLVFAHLQDRSGSIQFSLAKNQLGSEQLKSLSQQVSLGDFVGLRGTMWTTKTRERTVGVESLDVLSKAILPMPDKWAGISDTEVRYRKRYLDLRCNDESRQRFQTRSRIISFIRTFLEKNGFLEVETPILQAAACGASARPFITHHNALDRDFFLRISPETYLKRLVGGSLERVYELGKNFRNEGMDSSHLQEFTMLEWYAAYWDYRDNMRFVRELVQALCMEFRGTTKFDYQGMELDFGGDWRSADYRDLVRDATGIDLRAVKDLDALKGQIAARHLAVDMEGVVSYGSLVDLLYKKTVRPSLVQPTFLLHHPTEVVPLARRSDDDGTRLDMFQVLVNSWEIVKAYSELIDPLEQRKRLEEQVRLRDAGDDESMMLEEDFLECMEYGMPPMSGLGLGIDRVIALLTNAPTLRDVVFFPQMRDSQPDAEASEPDGGTS